MVKSYDEEIIILSDYAITDLIAPAIRSQSKSEEKIPFIKNETIYTSDRFINDKIVVYE